MRFTFRYHPNFFIEFAWTQPWMRLHQQLALLCSRRPPGWQYVWDRWPSTWQPRTHSSSHTGKGMFSLFECRDAAPSGQGRLGGTLFHRSSSSTSILDARTPCLSFLESHSRAFCGVLSCDGVITYEAGGNHAKQFKFQQGLCTF